MSKTRNNVAFLHYIEKKVACHEKSRELLSGQAQGLFICHILNYTGYNQK